MTMIRFQCIALISSVAIQEQLARIPKRLHFYEDMAKVAQRRMVPNFKGSFDRSMVSDAGELPPPLSLPLVPPTTSLVWRRCLSNIIGRWSERSLRKILRLLNLIQNTSLKFFGTSSLS